MSIHLGEQLCSTGSQLVDSMLLTGSYFGSLWKLGVVVVSQKCAKSYKVKVGWCIRIATYVLPYFLVYPSS